MSNSSEFVFQSDSAGATRSLGRRIGELAEPGTVVALIGPLGAGKTQLAKGIAVGLGVKDERKVSSPTFVIVREHRARLWMYHADAYRVSSPELSDIGFDEMCKASGLVVVEWADRVADLLPNDHLAITIEPTGAETRTLKCRATGDTSRRLGRRLADLSVRP